jgi:hypothetical protein
MIDEQFRDYCEEFAKLSGIPRIELIGMDGPEIKKLEEVRNFR